MENRIGVVTKTKSNQLLIAVSSLKIAENYFDENGIGVVTKTRSKQLRNFFAKKSLKPLLHVETFS